MHLLGDHSTEFQLRTADDRVMERKWVVALSVLGALILIVWAAFLTPPTHEVHTVGGTAVMTQFVSNTEYVVFRGESIPPSQSLDTIRCAYWRLSQLQSTSTCPDSDALARLYFPNVTQRSKTLYVPWRGCSFSWSDDSYGFNVEYLPASRTLLIHCFTAQPFVYLPRQPTMVAQPMPRPSLLLVPTDSLRVGTVSIVQDYRVEHLLGDRSNGYETAIVIATIS